MISKKSTREANELTYYNNPKLCEWCKKVISYDQRSYKCCSYSCSTTRRNVQRSNRFTKTVSTSQEYKQEIDSLFMECLFCSKQCIKKFCSKKCSTDYRKKSTRDEIISTQFDGTRSCSKAKKFILETRGHKCEICQGTEWFGNPMPLVIDHINGNSDDGRLENLRVICPNCDRFTPFFGSKNRGNGRIWRRKNKDVNLNTTKLS
jgi:hypothetical protein